MTRNSRPPFDPPSRSVRLLWSGIAIVLTLVGLLILVFWLAWVTGQHPP